MAAAPAGFGVAPLTPALLADPLAFLSAEHGRQMALLSHLERLARAPAAPGARVMAGALLRWLTEELPLHIADEERSLYPRLRPHAPREIEALSAEHRRDAALARSAVAGLRKLAAGGAAEPGFSTDAGDFARLHRRHLEQEEATLMPLARDVLTGEEIEALAREMSARRAAQGGA